MVEEVEHELDNVISPVKSAVSDVNNPFSGRNLETYFSLKRTRQV